MDIATNEGDKDGQTQP